MRSTRSWHIFHQVSSEKKIHFRDYRRTIGQSREPGNIGYTWLRKTYSVFCCVTFCWDKNEYVVNTSLLIVGNSWLNTIVTYPVTSGSIRLKTAVLMDISFAVLQNHYALSTSQIVIPQSIKSHQKEMRNPCSLDSTS